jgi:hypothetical protein
MAMLKKSVLTKSQRVAMLEDFEKKCPKNVPVTEDEIQEAVNLVRYGNKEGKNWVKVFANRGIT